MHNRIRQVRKSLKLSQNMFGKQIGFSASAINDIEHNNCKITDRFIISLCSIYHVNEIWLKTGNGEMFNKDDKIFNEFFEIFKSLSPHCQTFLIQVAKDLINLQNKLSRE